MMSGPLAEASYGGVGGIMVFLEGLLAMKPRVERGA